MLTWQYSDRFRQHWLLLEGEHVAMVDFDATGRPMVTVNRQRSFETRGCGRCGTVDFGKKMAERWARANLNRLRSEVAAQKAGRALRPWLPRG